MLKIGSLGLNTLIFISNLLHCAVCFHIFDSVTKMLAQNDLELEEALDTIILWKTFSSLLQNPSVCIFFFFFLCLKEKTLDIPCKRFYYL